MNKQEVIEKIEKEKSNLNAWEDLTRNRALDDALAIVRKLDEPEKPVVPQFVADWLEVCKENLAIGLFVATNPNVLEVNNQSAETIYWLKSARNQEIFAKAWLYGYEVEKEKLYTARLKLISRKESSYINKNKATKTLFIDDSLFDEDFKVHFTQAELEEIEVWNNPAFEIEEVEE